MHYDPANPLIVQGDRSILVEVDNPRYAEARDALAPFAELEKSPEHVHTYRLTSLSLWNAAATGMTAAAMVDVLSSYSKFPLPGNLPTDIADQVSRYGRVRLEKDGEHLRLSARIGHCLPNWCGSPKSVSIWPKQLMGIASASTPAHRGVLKQALLRWAIRRRTLPATPKSPHLLWGSGTSCARGCRFTSATTSVRRRTSTMPAETCAVAAVSSFFLAARVKPSSASLRLQRYNATTLILTTSITAVKQWHREILDKTDLTEKEIAEYTGESKNIGPITLATYQILTHRPDRNEDFPHFKLFDERNWGLIIYDEVHLLPAPVFRVTAQIQVRCRLGLTATLVREDGREADVFSLIGPKKYDVPWRELESRGWIAEATCTEVRVALPEPLRMEYAVAEWRNKYRIASENPAKDEIVARLLERYTGHRVLVIGQYLKQLRHLQKRFGIPLITGQTASSERELLYNQFRSGELRHLILSKVGNFAPRPTRRQRVDSGVGDVWFAAGRSTALGPNSSSENGE